MPALEDRSISATSAATHNSNPVSTTAGAAAGFDASAAGFGAAHGDDHGDSTGGGGNGAHSCAAGSLLGRVLKALQRQDSAMLQSLMEGVPADELSVSRARRPPSDLGFRRCPASADAVLLLGTLSCECVRSTIGHICVVSRKCCCASRLIVTALFRVAC